MVSFFKSLGYMNKEFITLEVRWAMSCNYVQQTMMGKRRTVAMH